MFKGQKPNVFEGTLYECREEAGSFPFVVYRINDLNAGDFSGTKTGLIITSLSYNFLRPTYFHGYDTQVYSTPTDWKGADETGWILIDDFREHLPIDFKLPPAVIEIPDCLCPSDEGLHLKKCEFGKWTKSLCTGHSK